MVRAIAGTLVEVGRGTREVASLPALLEGRDRARAGAAAPARGLCLMGVGFDADPPGSGVLSLLGLGSPGRDLLP